jgi:hypothetical protein
VCRCDSNYKLQISENIFIPIGVPFVWTLDIGYIHLYWIKYTDSLLRASFGLVIVST